MFLNENEESIKEAEKNEQQFINDPTSNSRIKKMTSYFSGDSVSLNLPKLYLHVQLRTLQNTELVAKQMNKLVSW